jgi:radical SAM superfamily enzyme YgiQ (UPF0313 family)
MTDRSATKVLLVFPKFNPNSFWSLTAVCDVRDAKCPAPPLGLITLAALLPKSWPVRLVNRNAEALTSADLAWADLVMTGGMLPQRPDTMEVIRQCKASGKPIVVGGPDVTSSPQEFEAADFRVLGEAEAVIDDFIAAWRAGAACGVFEGVRFSVDVTTVPIPRFDLLQFDHYLFVGVQYSRGCPFNCEFCDIIELFGRVPRAKQNDQMLAELQALYDAGYRGHVDFVDDNFIGNKKALKQFLPMLEAWQKKHKFPFQFSTEASINLSDDVELLRMMKRANFFTVFVGIESPDPETLRQTQKKQNTRRSIADSVYRIYQAGIFVVAGFIVGFDSEKGSAADGLIQCVEDTAIPVCMVGLLTALPNTQLTRRLEKEGRMMAWTRDHADQSTAGLNFRTLRPRAEILADLKRVLDEVYDPKAFFGRVTRVGLALDEPGAGPLPSSALKQVKLLGRLLGRSLRHREMLAPLGKALGACLVKNPASLGFVLTMAAFYLHLGPFSRIVIRDLQGLIEAVDPALDDFVAPRAEAALRVAI